MSEERSRAGVTEGTGPHTPSACIWSPLASPQGHRLETWVDGPCVWPRRATRWLDLWGGASLTWDTDVLRHRPNLLYCTDITLLLLQVFGVSDTGLKKNLFKR